MLIENTRDIYTYPLEELNRTLITYELNNAEVKEKIREGKEESKELLKWQIGLKILIEEEATSGNMRDEELDDLVILIKNWRGLRNNSKISKGGKGQRKE